MAEQKDQWISRRGFILAAIGSAIGLGNIWRFSWLCYKDGGGAFLVPYFIALLIVGIPLIILEFVLGNYYRGSSPTVFSKIRRGLEIYGWMATLNMFLLGIYYAVILAWVMDYIGLATIISWHAHSLALYNTSTHTSPLLSYVYSAFTKYTSVYWWVPTIGLIITWAITWFTVWSGVGKGIERACTYAIPALWILAAVLVVRGLTLSNSVVGINAYLTPNWAKMASGTVWIDAFGQILFTLSVMACPLVVYASYMPRKSEMPNSAWITAFANCGFSFFFGFATWGVIGYMTGLAYHAGVISSNSVAAFHKAIGIPLGGSTLAFTVIPMAIAKLPGAPYTSAVFGTIFFVILWLAGYSSLLSIIEPVYTAIRDKFGARRRLGTSFLAGISFALGLIFVMYPSLIDGIDFSVGTVNLIWLVLLESVIGGYYAVMPKIKAYINKYAELKLGKWFDFLIRYVAPGALGCMLIFGLLPMSLPGAEIFSGGHVVLSQMSTFILVWLLMIIASVIIAGTSWKTKAREAPNADVEVEEKPEGVTA